MRCPVRGQPAGHRKAAADRALAFQRDARPDDCFHERGSVLSDYRLATGGSVGGSLPEAALTKRSGSFDI
jgi:hypothetical protein